MLAALIPNGTNSYVGFYTVSPAVDGTGGTEAAGSGYARKVHAAWVNVTVAPVIYRVNTGAIEFAALTADLANIVAWGIWDAAVAGNLLAFGPLLDVAGTEINKTFTSGNQPRFVDGELKVGLE